MRLLLILGSSLLALACGDTSREVVCQNDGQCVRDGVDGMCLSPGHCAFPVNSSECASSFRGDSTAAEDLADECVSAVGGPDGGGGTNSCGGTVILPAEPGSECGACGSGQYQCSGGNAVVCSGDVRLESVITNSGSIEASTEFDSNFQAPLAMDLDFSTSWFSTGPQMGGSGAIGTELRWTASGDECISKVSITGNGQHSNSSFREDFGFGLVTVQVRDANGTPVFSETVSLAGTPDPDVLVEPDTTGRSVVLLLSGHESSDCGGLSEMSITGVR
jgi:hypothetical protein